MVFGLPVPAKQEEGLQVFSKGLVLDICVSLVGALLITSSIIYTGSPSPMSAIGPEFLLLGEADFKCVILIL